MPDPHGADEGPWPSPGFFHGGTRSVASVFGSAAPIGPFIGGTRSVASVKGKANTYSLRTGRRLFFGHDRAWPSIGCRILMRPRGTVALPRFFPWRDALRRVRLGIAAPIGPLIGGTRSVASVFGSAVAASSLCGHDRAWPSIGCRILMRPRGTVALHRVFPMEGRAPSRPSLGPRPPLGLSLEGRAPSRPVRARPTPIP